jgi:hypothetical protein
LTIRKFGCLYEIIFTFIQHAVKKPGYVSLCIYRLRDRTRYICTWQANENYRNIPAKNYVYSDSMGVLRNQGRLPERSKPGMD